MKLSIFSSSSATTIFQGRFWPLQAVLPLYFLVVSGANATQVRAAVEPQEVLWEDDFSTLDSSFGEPTEDLFVKDNVLQIKPAKNTGMQYLYQSALFENADATVRARVANPTAKTNQGVGLAFWAIDTNQYYVFFINDSGKFGIYRRIGGRWIYPVTLRETDALKTEAGEWNKLRLVTIGNRATVYVNEQEMATIHGQPPEGGSLIGVYTESHAESAIGEFSALKVVLPPETAEAVPAADPNILFSDDFTALDAGWVESSEFGVTDNKFHLNPKPNEWYSLPYPGIVFEDMDATVMVRLQDGEEESACGGAFAFWHKDAGDFWMIQLYDNGNVEGLRMTNNRWLKPLAGRPVPDEAKLDLGKGAELRVVTAGGKATVYVNGVLIGTVTGQPLAGGTQIGFYTQSGKAAATAEFSNLVVRKPGADEPLKQNLPGG